MKKLTYILILFFLASPLIAQVNTEFMRKKKHKKGWDNTIGLSFAVNAGNSEFFKIETGFRSDYYSGKYYTFLSGNLEHKETSNKIITQNGFLHLRSMRHLTGLISGEAFLQKEFNRFISLQDRDLGGLGLRLKALDIERENDSAQMVDLNLGIGGMYEYEEYNTNPEVITRILRSTNYVSFYGRINDILSFRNVAYFQFDVIDFNDFRVLEEGNIIFNIGKSLKFMISIEYRYDNEPSADVKKYDLEIKNEINVQF